MLKTKHGKSILRLRWGDRPRGKTHILRVSDFVFNKVRLVPERNRMRFVNDSIRLNSVEAYK